MTYDIPISIMQLRDLCILLCWGVQCHVMGWMTDEAMVTLKLNAHINRTRPNSIQLVVWSSAAICPVSYSWHSLHSHLVNKNASHYTGGCTAIVTVTITQYIENKNNYSQSYRTSIDVGKGALAPRILKFDIFLLHF